MGVVMAFYDAATRVKFISSDWETAQNEAERAEKLFFVDFDASYCASCRTMDESTYQDPALASFIEENVVALRLDVQDFDGVMWSQKYEVEALPTMLIFNEKGKLVKRLVGYKSAQALLKEFQTARSAVNPASRPQPIAEDRPLARPSMSAKKPAKASNTFSMYGNSATAARGKGLYEIDIKKATSAGFTVQIGVFKSHELLMQQANKISNRFQQQKTMVHVDEVRGEEVFKLLVGKFSDKVTANNFRLELKKLGLQGIIKDLRRMK